MVQAVSTLDAPQTRVLMVATALRSTIHFLVPVNLVSMATPVNTLANLVTMVTTAARNASAQNTAVAIVVNAFADRAFMGSTVNKFAALGILGTTVPSDVSVKMVHHVTLGQGPAAVC